MMPSVSPPPPTPRPPTPRLLLLVLSLYLGAGLPMGVVAELIPVWLHQQGSSLQTIGLASLISLPWTLKALWAPLVDRTGHARRWAFAALFGVASATILVPHLGLSPALWLVLLGLTTASATYDLAVDGWAASTVPREHQGRVNGLRVAAYRAAMIAAGGGAVALGGLLPWTQVFAIVGVLALLLLIPLPFAPAAPRSQEPPAGGWLAALVDWFRGQGILNSLGVIVFILLFKLGDASLGPMVKPFWLERGFSVEELGLVSITLGTALTMLGALVGGELTSRMGLFRSLWVLGGVQALSNLGYLGAAVWTSRPAVWAASMTESFTGGLGTASFLAVLMALTGGAQATTRFALLTALMGLTRTLSGAVSGYGASAMGFPGWFAFSFLLALPAFAFLPAIRRRLG